MYWFGAYSDALAAYCSIAVLSSRYCCFELASTCLSGEIGRVRESEAPFALADKVCVTRLCVFELIKRLCLF